MTPLAGWSTSRDAVPNPVRMLPREPAAGLQSNSTLTRGTLPSRAASTSVERPSRQPVKVQRVPPPLSSEPQEGEGGAGGSGSARQKRQPWMSPSRTFPPTSTSSTSQLPTCRPSWLWLPCRAGCAQCRSKGHPMRWSAQPGAGRAGNETPTGTGLVRSGGACPAGLCARFTRRSSRWKRGFRQSRRRLLGGDVYLAAKVNMCFQTPFP